MHSDNKHVFRFKIMELYIVSYVKELFASKVQSTSKNTSQILQLIYLQYIVIEQ